MSNAEERVPTDYDIDINRSSSDTANRSINPKEIAREYYHGLSDEQWEDVKDRFPYSSIPHIAKAHTNQTLQELKAKVEELYQNDERIDVCRGYDIALDDIVHLIEKRIDEAINE